MSGAPLGPSWAVATPVWVTLLCLAAVSASFTLEGTRTSYAQFRKWYPTPNGTIEFEFKTKGDDGRTRLNWVPSQALPKKRGKRNLFNIISPGII